MTVTVWPDAMLVLFKIRSDVTLPWMWQLELPSYMRKHAAVPVADAAADHVPAMVVVPLADVRNVAGSVMVQSNPVGSAAAQLAGWAPEKIFRVPEDPIAV